MTLIVIATDKWRGSFTSAQAAAAIAAGATRAIPDATLRIVPLADGGEGTLDVLEAAVGGQRHAAEVTGPLGGPVQAGWLELADGRTVLESATAIGLEHVPAGRRNPLRTTSRGAGELVRAALDAGSRDLILTLGGSATVDGGAGLAAALGYRLLDAAGEVLPEGGGSLAQLARIDGSGADPRLAGSQVEAWCDVGNLLLGPRGAARVYGPQKGAGEAAVERLEAGLERLAERIERDLGQEVASLPGSGAAGGLGAGAAAFLGAGLASGAGRVLDAVGFDAALEGADLVITGEGRYDADAMPGKLPDAVLARAAARSIPAAVLCGEHAASPDAATPQDVPVFSRRDLIDNRGWQLGESELSTLAELLIHKTLP